MKTQAYQLTKSQEIAMFAEVVRDCPAGYVKAILSDLQAEVERAITSDFGFVPFAEFERQKAAERAEMLAARAELQKLKSQIADLETRRNVLTSGLDSISSTVRQLSRVI